MRDAYTDDGKILPNGRMVYDCHLMQVKSPNDSKGRWDYYKPLRTISSEVAFETFEESGFKLAR